ncbi:MAG: VWA domain-containing protein [Pseudomonadota bacterium]
MACTNTAAFELVFLLDESGSVGFFNYQAMKSFARSITEQIDISDSKARVAVIAYASGARLALPLTGTRSTIVNALNSLTYLAGGTSFIQALTLANTVLTGSARANVYVYIMLVCQKSMIFSLYRNVRINRIGDTYGG